MTTFGLRTTERRFALRTLIFIFVVTIVSSVPDVLRSGSTRTHVSSGDGEGGIQAVA